VKPFRLALVVHLILLIGLIGPQGYAAGPATMPASRSAEVDSQRVIALTQRYFDLLKRDRFVEAEQVIGQVLALVPNNSLHLYNMACVKARLGNIPQALDFLERAARAGFTDFVHIERDPDLAELRQADRYRQIVAQKDEYQRQHAQRIVAWLRSELGEGYLSEIDEQNKLVFVTNTDQQTLQSLRSWLVRQAASQRRMLFEHAPDQYIAVVLPSPADYRQIVSRPGVGGFYHHSHDKRVLIVQRLGMVLTHEFTHALHAADIEPLGQEHAVWISEGLAAMFEAAQFKGEDLLPGDSFRLEAVQAAARGRRLIPLSRLVTMDQKAFTVNAVVNLTYGQSASLLLYLYETGRLRGFYDTYKATYDQDKSGKAALEKVTGKKLPEIERDWRMWMMGRTPPADSTGPDGAFLGIRFGEGNDGLSVQQVIAGGPADAAGVKVGDVVVGIDEAEVRDRYALVAALSGRRPGERIGLRLRRGEAYMDVAVVLGARPGRR